MAEKIEDGMVREAAEAAIRESVAHMKTPEFWDGVRRRIEGENKMFHEENLALTPSVEQRQEPINI